MNETIRLVIEGRVQGVGYRAFLVREATALDLAGWARNCSDGSVEAVASGSRDALAALIAAANRGPALSRVDSVREEKTEDAALGERRDGFYVKPDFSV